MESLLTATLPDGGPLYTETDLSRLVAEPLNALSAFPFFLIAMYWLYRMRDERDHQRFMTIAMCVLALGGIGGTLFHAFRASHFFFLLDVVPIALLSIGVSLHFLSHVTARWLTWGFFIVPLGILQRLAMAGLPRQFALNLSYALSATVVLLPAVLLLHRRGWENGGRLATAAALFGLALFMRYLDPFAGERLSVGTHWLWHLFSAASVWCLARFVYELNRHKLSSPVDR